MVRPPYECFRNSGAGISKFITIIYNSHTGLKTSNYKMVNMIDKLDCIDIQHSEYDRQSERKEMALV
ncbi:hypothetical protein B1J93_05410 [Leptospira kirschneri serovar Pomona]|uniref:Uncharacterized protein n=1 Tax=Leptospira kirschneri serovar Pomona TaxID=561005 RepID=A0A1T1DV24_9LEPT|nr:hypothetical protein B1J93_05410 [Leptospira kirschneri serovar Pomona]